MLHYALVKNPLRGEEHYYRGVPKRVKIHNTEEVIEEMTVPGGVTRTQAAAVLESFNGAIEKIISRGEGIRTDLCSIYPVIKGNFNKPVDTFDATNHSVELDIRPGKRLKRALPRIKLKKILSFTRQPLITSLHTPGSHEKEVVIVPGGILEIQGELLKIKGMDTGGGVYFCTDSGEFHSPQLHLNQRGKILCQIPADLSGSSCYVEIRTVIHGNKALSLCRSVEPLSITAE